MSTVKDALKDLKGKIKDTKDEIRSIPEIILPEQPVAPVRKLLQRRFPILKRQREK